MTEFKLEWSEKCIKEYVDISVMGKTAAQKIPFIVCAGLLGVIFLGGIIMFAVTGLISSLIISVCALLFAGVAVLLINLLCKKLAEKVKKAAEGYNDIVAGVSDNDILFIKNNLPYGVMEWDKIGEITEGKLGFYLISKEGSLLILDKSAVVSGELSEAQQVLGIKAAYPHKKDNK